jgi:pSer/pThr/pTyr-binding forkhead associated (FHA) protein
MPTLILKFEDRVLKEYPVDGVATIGRLPDNTLIIDNPAVSGHHARVFLDGDCYVVEDLRSKNGTYVNEQHVLRATLQDGDVLLVGKHKLVFDRAADAESVPAQPVQPTPGRTAYLDTKKHRAMLARLRDERTAAQQKAKTEAPEADGIAVLRVLGGNAELSEYLLAGQTSIIGKSSEALVRLRGWFKPKTAAAIVRTDTGYALTAVGAKTLVNSERVDGRRDLRDSDIVEVGGLILEFRLNGMAATDDSTASGRIALRAPAFNLVKKQRAIDDSARTNFQRG